MTADGARTTAQASEQGTAAEPVEPTSAPAPKEGEPEAPDAGDLVAAAEDRWRRALADLDNLRKRYTRELTTAREDERARVAAAWLPVVDNLERALEHVDEESSGLRDGIRVVRDQAVAVLEGLGFRRHADSGVPFDPLQHEVVLVTEDDGATPGTVVDVVRPGYGDGNRQLRPASVVVARRPG
jgi:molecular chaperone GrpE